LWFDPLRLGRAVEGCSRDTEWDRPGKDKPIIENIEVTTKVTAQFSGEEKKES